MVVVLLDASRVRGRFAIVAWFRVQTFPLVRGSGATEGLEVGEKDRVEVSLARVVGRGSLTRS